MGETERRPAFVAALAREAVLFLGKNNLPINDEGHAAAMAQSDTENFQILFL